MVLPWERHSFVRVGFNGPTASAHPGLGPFSLLADKREFTGIGGLRRYSRGRAKLRHFTLPQLWPQPIPLGWGHFFLAIADSKWASSYARSGIFSNHILGP